MSALFSCREAAKLASESQDHALPLTTRMALRLHLMMCAACSAYERQIVIIDAAFRLRAKHGKVELPTNNGLDGAARDRLLVRLRRGP